MKGIVEQLKINFRGIKKRSLLQLFSWATIMILYFLYLQVRWPESSDVLLLIHTLVAFAFFACIIYGYYYFIYPKYYKNTLSLKYIGICLLFLLLSIVVRIVTESEVVRVMKFEGSIFNYGRIQLLYDTVSSSVAFAIAVLFVYVNETFKSQRREQDIMMKQLQIELKLLKAQVQPHFLFNCLNSIYADAYEKTPEVAVSIERLSGLMRYFAHDNYLEKVPLEREIQFLKDYIDLELERSHIKHTIALKKDCADMATLIPPMLLIPLVENVFKHNFWSSKVPLKAFIEVKTMENTFYFKVKNQLLYHQEPSGTGSGLKNLKERLQIIFPRSHKFNTEIRSGYFIAELTFPI